MCTSWVVELIVPVLKLVVIVGWVQLTEIGTTVVWTVWDSTLESTVTDSLTSTRAVSVPNELVAPSVWSESVFSV